MAKKLFKVEAYWYVLAEDAQEAETRQPEWGSITTEAIEAHSVDNDWVDALPFGEDEMGERTCMQILQSEIK